MGQEDNEQIRTFSGADMVTLTLDEAMQKGYKDVFFTFDCIGDTILLLSATEYLAKQRKEKILIGTDYPELAKGFSCVDILENVSENKIKQNTLKQLSNHDINPVFICAVRLIWNKKSNQYITRWKAQHILANVCSRLGVSGYISLKTKLYLSSEEKRFGRFYDKNQIAITGSGAREYKSLSFAKSQEIVNKLKDKYNFVQVGSKADPILDNVLDMRDDGDIRKCASILYNSDLFVGGIGGLMHMARAVNCQSVIAYTSAEPDYLADYNCNINVKANNPSCNLCGKQQRFPYEECIANYGCISSLDVNKMIDAINKQINNKIAKSKRIKIKPERAKNITDLIKKFGPIR